VNQVITHAPDDDDEDGLDPEVLARATAICREENQRSVSLLQRRLRLGYTVASDLLDAIIERGLDEER
jgi:DNA segregation ATPase FtsK/SpoIIIE-like protein